MAKFVHCNEVSLCIEVLFDIFYYYWVKEILSSYRGLRYIEVRSIEVPALYPL